jgi:hypothetical protein
VRLEDLGIEEVDEPSHHTTPHTYLGLPHPFFFCHQHQLLLLQHTIYSVGVAIFCSSFSFTSFTFHHTLSQRSDARFFFCVFTSCTLDILGTKKGRSGAFGLS